METHFTENLRGHELKFKTTWGLFSPKHVDKGTLALLKCIDWPSYIHQEGRSSVRALDLGCGYGPIGISLAKELNTQHPNTTLEFHMVDKDFVAIEYSKENAQANGVEHSTKIYLSNAFRDIHPNIKFDMIVSNIPAKVGKDLLIHIIQEAHNKLEPGGKFYVVTINGLKEFMKRNFKEIFGNYKKCEQVPGYSVAMAEKLAEN